MQKKILFTLSMLTSTAAIALYPTDDSLGMDSREEGNRESSEVNTIRIAARVERPAQDTVKTVITNSVLLDSIASYESNGNWKSSNGGLYIGKWQMGRSAFRQIGYTETQIKRIFTRFQRNPSVLPAGKQKDAMYRWMGYIEQQLSKEIELYRGKEINGVTVTKAGILEAAHKVGVNRVKRYLSAGECRYKRRVVRSMEKYQDTRMFDSFAG
jgi:hypothetical protein